MISWDQILQLFGRVIDERIDQLDRVSCGLRPSSETETEFQVSGAKSSKEEFQIKRKNINKRMQIV